MPFLSILTRLPPRPIAQYVLALLFVLVLALGVMAGFVFHDTNRLQEQIAQTNENLARQELEEAVTLLTQQANNVAQAMAQWDEARQQLDDPIYYGYWRNSRALSAGILPESLDAIDLYDLKGHNLSSVTTGEDSMPAAIATQGVQPYLVHENGHDHLYFFYPFYQDGARTHQIGHMGFKYDFLREITMLRKFRYLDIESVRVKAGDGKRIPLTDIVPSLHFKTIENPETRQLEKIITRSFFEIGAIIAAISLIGYLALVSVVTKPLRRLSGHIDAMRRGKGKQLNESYRGVLPVTELENVRQSLNDYQQQLDDMNVNLARKNRELWTLAHHDPLTGVFNRRAFDDDWDAMHRSHSEAVLEVAFLLFDCDHFKAINDTYGHQVGDQVLQGLGESLHGALRAGDRLYRLGGTSLQPSFLLQTSSMPDRLRSAARSMSWVLTSLYMVSRSPSASVLVLRT